MVDPERPRVCRFEDMEPRLLMNAAPLQLGAVYVEADTGGDHHGDRFEVLFTGGAPGTQLTRLEIDGDHFAPGLSFGDMIFDTARGGYGADDAFAFEIVSADGIDRVRATVTDGSSRLVLELTGFEAGEKLVFSIDVDEVQDFNPAETNLDRINEGLDPIASGVEFQESQLHATFTAPHFQTATGQGSFRNVYDSLFQGTNLLLSSQNPQGLPPDNFENQRDRTGGVLVTVGQVPLPISISGKVFLDRDENLAINSGEPGIAGVTLALWKKNGDVYEDTGFTTRTDADGQYRFGQNLGLTPGVYQVREVQPAGYFSVGAIPGTVAGVGTGNTVAGEPNILTEIEIPLGDTAGEEYNFAEVQPGSLTGRVFADRDGNCIFHDGDRPLSGVTLNLFDSQGALVGSTTTDSEGRYRFENLHPGVYEIREVQPAGYLQGSASVGSGGGDVTADDVIANIELASGDSLVDYDFCEIEPASLAGLVHVDNDRDCLLDTDEAGIAGVTVQLLDANGNVVASTTTASDGTYRFAQLRPGTYTVRETQPVGYFHGGQTAGTGGGDATLADVISAIEITPGATLQQYNFCEIEPGSIAGFVHIDSTRNCVFDAGESPLAGITLELFDASGNQVGETTSDVNGFYRFTGLPPGTYSVRQRQPGGYFDGGQSAGSGGGNASGINRIDDIVLTGGSTLVDYNFCELEPGSIAGFVHVDRNVNGVFDPGEQPLAGIRIELRNAAGELVQVANTDSNGFYQFGNLAPGVYSLRETQPTAYFDGGQVVGSGSGDASGDNEIVAIGLPGGAALVQYNFAELLGSTISGVVFRDGDVIQTADGQVPENLAAIRDGQLTPDDLRLAGVKLQLWNALDGTPVQGEDLLPGLYPSGDVFATTNELGYYEFRGLPRGSYAVLQVQPDGYADSRDTPGTRGGIAINSGENVPQTVTAPFESKGVRLNHDALLRIGVDFGNVATNNNFSEVQVTTDDTPPPPPPPRNDRAALPIVPFQLGAAAPPLPSIRPYTPPVEDAPQGHDGGPPAWHLSVVNGGQPRSAESGFQSSSAQVLRAARSLDAARWRQLRLATGSWQLPAPGEGTTTSIQFGLAGATPLAGDFNGDGRAELVLYHEGEWFIDLNGNGQWDEHDMWARLGSRHDAPVIGDWDGDGKDDIGIFGPRWPRDPVAVKYEPGLPDAANRVVSEIPKNVPPAAAHATDGARHLKRAATAAERSDRIDHVFFFGGSRDVPLAGDFNGDGIDTVAVFHNGLWQFDLNGDGRFTSADRSAQFGQARDVPLVGDFDGDGVDEIAVWRNGELIIDSNHNGQFDAGDQRVQIGSPGDTPVVADFNGDGRDEVALHTSDAVARTARRAE
jgi:protocatechuate 3,4-dioxygenase beta subunit